MLWAPPLQAVAPNDVLRLASASIAPIARPAAPRQRQSNHPLTKSPHGSKKVVRVIAAKGIGASAKSSPCISRSAFIASACPIPARCAIAATAPGADVDVYALGREECPLVSECKSRKAGGGFVQLERWLGENDLLFLRRDHAEPLVLLPWRVWARLLAKVRP